MSSNRDVSCDELEARAEGLLERGVDENHAEGRGSGRSFEGGRRLQTEDSHLTVGAGFWYAVLAIGGELSQALYTRECNGGARQSGTGQQRAQEVDERSRGETKHRRVRRPCSLTSLECSPD